jgi:hypothetical protein
MENNFIDKDFACWECRAKFNLKDRSIAIRLKDFNLLFDSNAYEEITVGPLPKIAPEDLKNFVNLIDESYR